ncbi:hypothetical protein AVEN_272278-1 [Araneus ventricosus]|uniref:Uncharacterized protein n=1 Tax=Araneus ventricosus TaxID=182803 RepID=A0A4Y2LJJ7_ARAVE|nr:hypothetical protein AVEN_272278-1 [Araneus ventricosus]
MLKSRSSSPSGSLHPSKSILKMVMVAMPELLLNLQEPGDGGIFTRTYSLATPLGRSDSTSLPVTPMWNERCSRKALKNVRLMPSRSSSTV